MLVVRKSGVERMAPTLLLLYVQMAFSPFLYTQAKINHLYLLLLPNAQNVVSSRNKKDRLDEDLPKKYFKFQSKVR